MDSNGEKVFTSFTGDFADGTPSFIYVKNGRIIRARPMVFDKNEAKPWSIKAGNKAFSPPKRAYGAPWDMAVRRRTYNPRRAQYPMKRVGFEPGGKSSVENRGKGEFVPISWDEALDIVASELNRIKKTYGNSAILTMANGHNSSGLLNSHGLIRRVLDFWGGQTPMERNPDSWEGWYWGAVHVWGFDIFNGGCNHDDMLEDTMQYSELCVFWSHDMEKMCWIGGQDMVVWLPWLKELGKKMIFISPDLNYTAGTKADKWIPIRPGTDAALAPAIAYIWLNTGTYDDEYVHTHAVGFDKWKEYVLGQEDGIPKTPEWAEGITGVPARTIKALAREWASKKTNLCTNQMGGACRTPYSTEWPRMMIFLQAMQGLGKPGVNIGGIVCTAPVDKTIKFPPKMFGAPSITGVASVVPQNPVKQTILQTLMPKAILEPPVSWCGGAICGPVEEQFIKSTYPMTDHSEIHMIWWDTVSQMTNWNNTNKWAEAYRSPKIEFTVAQTPFLENDALFADIVLPACTQLEREDFCFKGGAALGHGADNNNSLAIYMKKCVEPLYESKSDYEICRLVAAKLGVEQEFTEGNTPEDWIRKFYEVSSLPKYISFEDFKEKGYFVFKFPDEWPRNPRMTIFRQKGTGLKTPSGKLEFFSQRLADNYPDDNERPPVPHYVANGETHQESLTSPRAKKYPLLVLSSHPRFRFHSQHETIPWFWEIRTQKVLKDGTPYEAIWMHPQDAKARGIKPGDIVRIFNERGAVLCGAFVTERMMPGVVSVPNGAGYNPIEIGKLEGGGVINTISPLNTTSKNAFGMASNAFLAQVEKWKGALPKKA